MVLRHRGRDVMRRYGTPPWVAAVLHGGPGAPGTAAALARGLGRTAGTLEPIQSRRSVDRLVDELRGQLSEATREPVALIGHSWGAWLALLCAARHPETARHLVLVGSGPLTDSFVPAIAARRAARLTAEQNAAYASAIAALQTGDGYAMRQVAELTSISDNYRLLPEEAGDALPSDPGQHAAVWREAKKLRTDGGLVEAARAVRCPVTVLHGEDDPHPADGVAEPLRAAGVAFDLRVFPRCGHYPFREEFAAEAFFAALRALLWRE